MSIIHISTGLLYSLLLALIALIILASWKYLLLRRSYHELKVSEVSRVNILRAQLEEVKDQLERANQEISKVEEDCKKRLVISNLTIIESERRTIGADMHDFIGSMLWAVKIQLNVISRKGEPNEFGLLTIQKANEIIDETLSSTRKVIGQLVPKTFLTSGIAEAIKEHCEYISTDKMHFEFSESGERHLYVENNRRTVVLFRVIQEILNNCVKYSEASRIAITFNWGLHVIVSIVNNGKPFQLDDCLNTKVRGVGVFNIIDRVNAMGGSVSSEAGPPNTILIQIP